MGRKTITCYSCCANITEKNYQRLEDSFPKWRREKEDEIIPIPKFHGCKNPREHRQNKKKILKSEQNSHSRILKKPGIIARVEWLIFSRELEGRFPSIIHPKSVPWCCLLWLNTEFHSFPKFLHPWAKPSFFLYKELKKPGMEWVQLGRGKGKRRR